MLSKIKFFLRFIFFSFTFFFVYNLSVSAASSYPDDEFANFQATYVLNQDGTISVSEEIDYFTSEPKHGIFRYLPTVYNNGLKNKVNWRSVRDHLGEGIPFSVSDSDGNTVVKIGDATKTFFGQKKYIIAYDVTRPIQSLEDHDELYWDVVGEGWEFPIQKTQVLLHSPFASFEDVRCYSGDHGLNDGLCQVKMIDEYRAELNYSQPLKRGQNLTFVAILSRPNNLLINATIQREKYLKNLFLGAILVSGIIFIFVLIYLYQKHAADQVFVEDVIGLEPEGNVKSKPLFGRIRPRIFYEPFPNLTAVQAGFLLDKESNPSKLVAIILDLAQKKYLKIDVVNNNRQTGILQAMSAKIMGNHPDYILKKLPLPRLKSDNLDTATTLIYEQLFASEKEVKVSEIGDKFYKKTSDWPILVKNDLIASGYLIPPSDRKMFFIILFIGFSIFLFVLFNIINSDLIAFLFLFLSLCVFLFKKIFYRDRFSAKGSYYKSLCLGLKESIKTGKWQEEIKEKELYIDKILPYAVAFGVVNQLARDMGELNLPPPSYFESSVDSDVFRSSSITRDFASDFTHNLEKSIATSLSQTSSGSFHSSGGGGISGGGGGGGGGGSW